MSDDENVISGELVTEQVTSVDVEHKSVNVQDLERMGIMMPMADPAALRAAFAYKMRILTSILDPDRDMIYSIRYYDSGGKQKQIIANSLREAKEKAKHLNGSWSAHPKKSGVMKLAHALGIETRLVERTGLPTEPNARFSSCRYVATHKRTGFSAEGQGYCDAQERDKNHAIISMADTRAYCHAVLRCAGYDQVGAEALDLDNPDDNESVTIQPARPENMPALPESTGQPSGTVVSAPSTSARPKEVAAATETPPTSAAPQGRGDVITNAMAAQLSAKLLAKLGSKPKAKDWLVANAGVERTIYVREDQFNKLDSMLDSMEVPGNA